MKPYLIGEGQLAQAFVNHFESKHIEFDWFKSKTLNRHFRNSDFVVNRLYLCCVQDRQIQSLFDQIPLDTTSLFLIFSGNMEINSILTKNTVVKLHPMMTFPQNSPDDIISKSPFLFVGNISQLELIKSSIKIVNLFQFNITNPEAYHLMGVFASNFIIALMKIIQDLGERNSINPKEALNFILPIMKQTIVNLESGKELNSILSGPAKRKDKDTIEAHLRYLKGHPLNYDKIYSDLTGILQQLSSDK